MRKELIVAKKNGQIAAQAEVDWPESLKEAVKLDGEETVLEYYWKGKKLAERSKLYPRNSKPRKLVKTEEVYRKLLAAGLDEAQAREISQYQGA